MTRIKCHKTPILFKVIMESAGLLPIAAYSHVHSEFIMYLWVEAVGSDICPNARRDRVFDMVIICTMKNLGS